MIASRFIYNSPLTFRLANLLFSVVRGTAAKSHPACASAFGNEAAGRGGDYIDRGVKPRIVSNRPGGFCRPMRVIPDIFIRSLLAAFVCVTASSAFAAPFDYREQVFKAGGGSWTLSLPVGYVLELLVEMDGPRLMTFDRDGALLVGSRAGRVYRLEPPYSRAAVHAKLGDYPHDVALRDGTLFVARTGGVYRTPYQPDASKPLDESDFELVARLPSGGGHSSRSVEVGPDKRVYASVGISGNCSNQYLDAGYPFRQRRGGLLVLVEPGAGKQAHWQPYATGLRNPVGFDWHPHTGVLYASNHGPDHHGYDQPPEYFARLEAGSFHGMPWFQFDGREVKRDRCIGKQPPREDARVPVATFPARNGPMGVAFAERDAGVVKAGDAVVALHGSWATRPHGGAHGARSSRRPPWVALLRFDGDKVGKPVALIEGFQDAAGRRFARPIGVAFGPAFGPGNALYFTSDGGAVEGLFRLSRSR